MEDKQWMDFEEWKALKAWTRDREAELQEYYANSPLFQRLRKALEEREKEEIYKAHPLPPSEAIPMWRCFRCGKLEVITEGGVYHKCPGFLYIRSKEEVMGLIEWGRKLERKLLYGEE